MCFKFLRPLILDKNGSVFKIDTWISVFRRKKRLINPLHGLQVTAILVVRENSGVFIETPCRLSSIEPQLKKVVVVVVVIVAVVFVVVQLGPNLS